MEFPWHMLVTYLVLDVSQLLCVLLEFSVESLSIIDFSLNHLLCALLHRYLVQNIDWLQEQLGDDDDDYFLFDCPGKRVDDIILHHVTSHIRSDRAIHSHASHEGCGGHTKTLELQSVCGLLDGLTLPH